jgi:hypothetical protein
LDFIQRSISGMSREHIPHQEIRVRKNLPGAKGVTQTLDRTEIIRRVRVHRRKNWVRNS